MPWTGPQFASRFNHGLTPDEAAHAARIFRWRRGKIRRDHAVVNRRFARLGRLAWRANPARQTPRPKNQRGRRQTRAPRQPPQRQ